MIDAIFGGAEHHLGFIAARHAAQMSKEVVAVHHRHVPVEQNRLGHRALADFKRSSRRPRPRRSEIETFQDAARDLSDDAGIIDDQTCSSF
jgi:hypothetical protein